MKYYLIHENQMFIADNETVLSRYYSEEIKILPDDYNSEKYIVVNGELIVNPDYDEMFLKRKRQEKTSQNETLAKEHLLHEIIIPVTEDEILCTFIYNEQTERNLNSASLMLLAGVIETKQWTDENGITVMLTKDDIIKIGTMFNLYADKTWKLWGDYEEQIREAQTVEEIEAIDLNYNINISIEDTLEENLEL